MMNSRSHHFKKLVGVVSEVVLYFHHSGAKGVVNGKQASYSFQAVYCV